MGLLSLLNKAERLSKKKDEKSSRRSFIKAIGRSAAAEAADSTAAKVGKALHTAAKAAPKATAVAASATAAGDKKMSRRGFLAAMGGAGAAAAATSQKKSKPEPPKKSTNHTMVAAGHVVPRDLARAGNLAKRIAKSDDAMGEVKKHVKKRALIHHVMKDPYTAAARSTVAPNKLWSSGHTLK